MVRVRLAWLPVTAGLFTYTRLLTVTTNSVSSLSFYHPHSPFNTHLCEHAVANCYLSVCHTRDPRPNDDLQTPDERGCAGKTEIS